MSDGTKKAVVAGLVVVVVVAALYARRRAHQPAVGPSAVAEAPQPEATAPNLAPRFRPPMPYAQPTAPSLSVGEVDGGARAPATVHEATMILLDAEGRPLAHGQIVDPESDDYRRLIPPGVKLPTRAEVERRLQELQPAAEDCVRAQEGGDKGGVIASRFFFHGGDAPTPEKLSVTDEPAAACLHDRLSEGGHRDGQLMMTQKGAWLWSVYHEFKVAPR